MAKSDRFPDLFGVPPVQAANMAIQQVEFLIRQLPDPLGAQQARPALTDAEIKQILGRN